MPTKLKDVRRPQGLLRISLRIPIWLFRLHLGWVLGDRFLLLTHRGRESELLHQTVLEVLRHDKTNRRYYVISGWGERTDWAKNLERTPTVTIMVGIHLFPVYAQRLSVKEAEEVILDYARRNPLAMRVLSGLMGYRIDSTHKEDIYAFARLGVVFAFRPLRADEQ